MLNEGIVGISFYTRTDLDRSRRIKARATTDSFREGYLPRNNELIVH